MELLSVISLGFLQQWLTYILQLNKWVWAINLRVSVLM